MLLPASSSSFLGFSYSVLCHYQFNRHFIQTGLTLAPVIHYNCSHCVCVLLSDSIPVAAFINFGLASLVVHGTAIVIVFF